jgi:hypothetical protein
MSEAEVIPNKRITRLINIEDIEKLSENNKKQRIRKR